MMMLLYSDHIRLTIVPTLHPQDVMPRQRITSTIPSLQVLKGKAPIDVGGKTPYGLALRVL